MVEWSERDSTTREIEERLRHQSGSEEGQVPPRGKKVSAAQVERT
jgi:hypothetical protein